MQEFNTSQQVIVKGVLFDDNSLLLVQRSSDESYFPGFYELPGGKVEKDEDVKDALKREIKEETGLIIEVSELLHSSNDIDKNNGKQYISLVFKVYLEDKAKNSINLTESHAAYLWANCENDLESIELTDLTRSIMNKLCKVSKNINKLTNTDNVNYDVIDIYTDGGSRGNPGPSASGYVMLTPDGGVIEEGGEYLGITTNNQAEYQAVKLALEAARKYKPSQLRFFIDSLLVVNQLKGIYKIRNKDLWPVHQSIKSLSSTYKKVTFQHVRREYNKLADNKVNEVLDSYRS